MTNIELLENIKTQRDDLYENNIAINGISLFDTQNTSEIHLNSILTNKYSKYWIFSNPQKEKSKEFCDFVIFSQTDIIIISDKSNTNTKKWKNIYLGHGAFNKSIEQLIEAKKWILENEYFFNDKLAKEKIPFKIKPDMKVHLITTLSNWNELIQKHHNNNGLLKIKIENEFAYRSHKYYAFNKLKKEENLFFHIFDTKTLSLLINNLDTISDLSNYLTKREKFFRHYLDPLYNQNYHIEINNELCLLHEYYLNNEDFKLNTLLNNLTYATEYQNKITTNNHFEYYLTDYIIDILTSVGISCQINPRKNIEKFAEQEKVRFFLLYLVGLNRKNRIFLNKNIIDCLSKNYNTPYFFQDFKGNHFVFLNNKNNHKFNYLNKLHYPKIFREFCKKFITIPDNTPLHMIFLNPNGQIFFRYSEFSNKELDRNKSWYTPLMYWYITTGVKMRFIYDHKIIFYTLNIFLFLIFFYFYCLFIFPYFLKH